jgi:hypothetical protein
MLLQPDQFFRFMAISYISKNLLFMKKAAKYAGKGLAIGGLVKVLGNILDQRQRMQLTPSISFDWGEFLQEVAKGSVVGGLIGGGIGAISDYHNSLEAPINTDLVLHGMLRKVKLDPSDEAYIMLKQKGETIIQLIKQRFGSQLKREPLFMGSTERGTALRGKFDIDIGLLFFHASFYSTADMFDAVYDYAYSLIGKYGIVEVRVQKKSVGIICRVNNKELKIDLVPCKATKRKGYSNTGYLCVNKGSFYSDDSTYTKTNLHLLNRQKLSPAQKNLVLLLKEWKHRKEVPLPSYLLENLVLGAYQHNWGRISGTLTGKLVMVHITVKVYQHYAAKFTT